MPFGITDRLATLRTCVAAFAVLPLLMLCRLSANQPAMSRYPLTVPAPRPPPPLPLAPALSHRVYGHQAICL